MSGTVNISRGIWDDTAFKPEPFTEREAFMWMVMEASYKPRSKPVGKIWVDTERGQLACSVRFMSNAWGWSKSRVDRFLVRLENRDMIGTENGTAINTITICKYDEYQNVPGGSGTVRNEKRDSSGTAAGQQRDKPNKGLIPDVIREKGEPNGSLPNLPEIDVIAESVSAYNVTAKRAGWPMVQKMTPARRASLKARLADAGGPQGWIDALAKAEASDFLCGRKTIRGDPFFASFDFLVNQSKFVGLMEGKYDNRHSNSQGSGNPRDGSMAAAYANVAARMQGGS